MRCLLACTALSLTTAVAQAQVLPGLDIFAQSAASLRELAKVVEPGAKAISLALSDPTGASPYDNLTWVDGILYGVTPRGGSCQRDGRLGCGMVFQLVPRAKAAPRVTALEPEAHD